LSWPATRSSKAPSSLAGSLGEHQPIAGTDSCQAEHFGYVLAGAMTIHMDDGQEMEVAAGDVFSIPPGHDAEVNGAEPCVMVDFGQVGAYAKSD
jgi:mannose-6-phosphate isomerase-like protein (cupin superfamily)